MGGGPWDLLDLDADAGIEPLEFGHELGDHLPFPPHRPETHHLALVASSGATEQQRQQQRQKGGTGGREAHAASQPPVKPARSSPRRICGLPRSTFQTRPLR